MDRFIVLCENNRSLYQNQFSQKITCRYLRRKVRPIPVDRASVQEPPRGCILFARYAMLHLSHHNRFITQIIIKTPLVQWCRITCGIQTKYDLDISTRINLCKSSNWYPLKFKQVICIDLICGVVGGGGGMETNVETKRQIFYGSQDIGGGREHLFSFARFNLPLTCYKRP